MNLSILHSDVMKDRSTAMYLTVLVLQEAEAHIEDFVGEADFTDSNVLIESLRENLRLWKDEEEEEENKRLAKLKGLEDDEEDIKQPTEENSNGEEK
jgi:hypothetical protein